MVSFVAAHEVNWSDAADQSGVTRLRPAELCSALGLRVVAHLVTGAAGHDECSPKPHSNGFSRCLSSPVLPLHACSKGR
jgi:hypothetical protein